MSIKKLLQHTCGNILVFVTTAASRGKKKQTPNPPNCCMNKFATAAVPTEAEPLGKL